MFIGNEWNNGKRKCGGFVKLDSEYQLSRGSHFLLSLQATKANNRVKQRPALVGCSIREFGAGKSQTQGPLILESTLRPQTIWLRLAKWLVELKLKRNHPRQYTKHSYYLLLSWRKNSWTPHKSAARPLPNCFFAWDVNSANSWKWRFIFESFRDTPPIKHNSERQAATQEHNIGDYWTRRKECSAAYSTPRCKLSDMKSFHNFGDESFKIRTFLQYLWVCKRVCR